MNVITAYLETMFGAYPQTPRMAEAKAELHAMMEDAYHGYLADGLSENEAVGRVITEFGNLDELAPQLGIAAEIAPAAVTGGAGASARPAPARSAPAAPPVTLDEAERYADARRTGDPRMAIAVALFVMSPAPLIALATLSNGATFGLGQQAAVLTGLVCLLVIVAVGVMMLVRREQQLAPFARLAAGRFTRSVAVDRWADALAAEAAPRRAVALQVAVGLWILAVGPVLAVSLLAPPAVANVWIGVAVAGMLLIIATGLFVFLRANWAASTAETLTRGGSTATRGADDERSIVGVVAAFYWPVVVAVFLGWSFIGNAWYISWVIWPIAAVLFGALASGLRAIDRYRAAE
ncbi:MAG TPA: permease prefix domain 1-containing protein [Agromyces sp.]